MKISYNWLRDFVAFTHSPQDLGALLDQLGFGVESLNEYKASWSKVVVGKVLTCEPVPKSDHLSLCSVNVGEETFATIVCGAPNVAAGQTVPVAVVGAELDGGFKITKRKLRGVESHGMICSERELKISDESSGIMVLPDDLPIGSPLEDHICINDWVYDLEVTFNRPDCLSHIGIAREIAASTGVEIKLPSTEINEDAVPTSDKVSVEIKTSKRCPRYSARVLEGVTIKPSPLYMQERLRSVGVRPINNVVDVTNYILMELGHPLHAFDYHLVSDGEIIVRLADKGDQFTTLDDKKHILEETDLMIADPEHAIAIGGVMGGQNSEIKDETKDVLLECACFEPVGIRITSRNRAITTESSHRFERGVDPEMTIYAIDRAAQLINELAGGKVLQGIVDNYAKPWEPTTISLRTTRANKLLATDLSSIEMGDYLKALGCTVNVSDTIEVIPPSWRHDLEREIDLIEEIARLYGYDKIETAVTSSVPLVTDPDRERERKLINRFKQVMVELGMYEANSFSLIPGSDEQSFPEGITPVRVQNPLSEDMAILRPNLASSLLRAVERSQKNGTNDIRLFEWGRCFRMESGQVQENWHLAGVLTGKSQPTSWAEQNRDMSFFDLKGLIEILAEKISLDKVRFISYHIHSILQFGGDITVGEQDKSEQIGIFGQIDSVITKNFGIETPVWYFELNGDKMLSLAGKQSSFKPLPRFPAALRDLAFIVKDSIMAGQIRDLALKAGGELLEEVEVFDLFRGGSIPEGNKSLAFHLIYRSPARTLSDEEVENSIKRIIASVAEEVGAELRSL
ncbi:MAG: phenylalanine--tRNA ligase subunit beta [Calditrichaeota bacterium]|jgi:phenylalanyl-tRNA synthetase beta chain|nr:phenylalanine--tRNA ligase subunit beta [Calditrichota bacterium]